MEQKNETGGIVLAKVDRGEFLKAMETVMAAMPWGKAVDKNPVLGCVYISISRLAPFTNAILTLIGTDSVIMAKAQITTDYALTHTAEIAVDANALFSFINCYHGEGSSEVEIVLYTDLSFEHYSHKVDGVEPDVENAYGTSVCFRCGCDEKAIEDKYLGFPKAEELMGKWFGNEKNMKVCVSLKTLERIILVVRNAGGDRVEFGFVDDGKPFSFWASNLNEPKNAEGIVAPLLSHH